jgi:hypothetical protein
MESGLNGRTIVCHVDVTTAGQATTNCDQDPAIPALLVREAKKIVEESPWGPAVDEAGVPCQGKVTVKFLWGVMQSR